MTYYITYVEKGCAVAVKQLDEAGLDEPNIWRVYSAQKRFVFYFKRKLTLSLSLAKKKSNLNLRYEENYLIEVEFINGKTKKVRKATYQASFGKFFDENGNLVSEIYFDELRGFFEKMAQDK